MHRRSRFYPYGTKPPQAIASLLHRPAPPDHIPTMPLDDAHAQIAAPACDRAEPDTVERILAALRTLTFREREIIKLRYGLGDGYTYTLEEVGEKLGITRERVRQIQIRGLRKMGHPSRGLEGL